MQGWVVDHLQEMIAQRDAYLEHAQETAKSVDQMRYIQASDLEMAEHYSRDIDELLDLHLAMVRRGLV